MYVAYKYARKWPWHYRNTSLPSIPLRPSKSIAMAMNMTIHNTTQSPCKAEIMNRGNLQINANMDMDMDIHPKSSKILKLPRPGEELYIIVCGNGSRLHVTHILANMFVVDLNGAIAVVDRPISEV